MSKVASFKPNGGNYIDEDTTINNEQVNKIFFKIIRFRLCFFLLLYSKGTMVN